MSTLNDEINLNILIYGLEHYPDDLPQESAQSLRQAITAVEQQQPGSQEDLVLLVSRDAHLDQLYRKSLRTQMQGYVSQGRAKSLGLALHQTLNPELVDAMGQIREVLDRILLCHKAEMSTQVQDKILKTLEKSHLTCQDLTYTLNQPPQQTIEILRTLWQKGYIDELSTALPYILFPGLRSSRYRNTLPAADTLLTLTAKGYFHLYPLINRPDRMVSA